MKEKKIKFLKYSALGNDYIVIDPNLNDFEPSSNIIANICNRNFGVGADGILLGPIFEKERKDIPFVRIFNSDGSEAEKSGNGLRIFSQYLLDEKYIDKLYFTNEEKEIKEIKKIKKIKKSKEEIEIKEEINNVKDEKCIKQVYIKTIGGVVKAKYNSNGTISIQMGKIEFLKQDLEIKADDKSFSGTYLSIGNPHFSIILNEIDENIAKRYGPLIEENPFFPNKTNVQFVQVLDKNKIKIEIYERGSGYTLASGSSACASAAAAFKKGLVGNDVEVIMRGGNLKVEIDNEYNITQTGTVKFIFSGIFFLSTFLDKFQN